MSNTISAGIALEKTRAPKALPPEDNYGFGRYFSDHMFITDYSGAKGWNSARIVPYQNLQIDPGASVLHYGQAIFEGMKAFRGVDGKIRLFRPDMNHQRMEQSADRLCMKMLGSEMFGESLKALVRADERWVPKRDGTALYLRPTLIGTEGFLGVRAAENFIYYVIASPVGSYYGDGMETVKIWVEPRYSRAAPGGIGAAKAGGNYASSLLAATEAKKHGYSQVLWLDACEKRYVEEVGTMNVFFVIGDRVVTPALSGSILPGVTRDSVIHLLNARGMRVEERPVELAEIVASHKRGELKEIFGTGTAASISPVGVLGVKDAVLRINDEKVGAVSRELHKTLNDIQYGRIADEFRWTVEVTV